MLLSMKKIAIVNDNNGKIVSGSSESPPVGSDQNVQNLVHIFLPIGWNNLLSYSIIISHYSFDSVFKR